MSLSAVIVATSLVLGTLLAVCVAVGVSARVVRRTRERGRARVRRRMWPLVMAVLDDPGAVDALPVTGRDGRAVRSIVAGLLPKLRGADRDQLAAVLVRGGQLDRARRDLRARRARRRVAAVELLGAAGDSSADVDLARLVGDRDERVRVAAVRALGRLGTSVAAAALVDALTHERVPANAATMALLRSGAPAGAALLTALHDADAADRSVIAELLGVLGVQEARASLEAMLTSSTTTASERISAAAALGRLGDPASTTLLLDTLHRAGAEGASDLDLAVACVTALGLIGDRRAIPALTDALGGSHRLSFAAAEALAPMGPRRSRRSMRERGDTTTAPVATILASRRPVGATHADGRPARAE